jgi:hypothetical protein
MPGYHQNYALMVSPERNCFLAVCSGNIFKLKSQSVTIYKPTQNGKVYFTTANQNGAQIDYVYGRHGDMLAFYSLGRINSKKVWRVLAALP